MSIFETDLPDFYKETIRSLEWDEHLQSLRIMVYLTIADVDPDETQDSKQELCIIHARSTAK